MQKKLFIVFFAVLLAGFYFAGNALAINDLGGSCNDDNDCIEGLLCSERGTCLGCESEDDCESGETCDAVCVRPGGNLLGDFCGEDAQCASRRCGTGRRCLPPVGTTEEGSGGTGGNDDWLGIDLSIQDVAYIIEGIACWLLRVSMLLAIIFIILAGIRFMAAQGNPASYQKAKTNFFHVLIGVIVITGIYEIIATVANAVGRTDFSFIPLIC